MTEGSPAELSGTGAASRPARLRSAADAAAAYRLVHHRIDALLRGRGDAAEYTVPACPAWTVRQLAGHLAGTAQDVVSLNLEGAGTDAWTQAQVDRIAGDPLDDLLDRWGQLIEPVTQRLALAPDLVAAQLVFDVLTHEHDLRGALGDPGSRTADPAFAVAVGFLTTSYDQAIRACGLPALRLTTPTTGPVQLGDPAGAAGGISLVTSDFDLLRALGGRRSVRQLLALPWTADREGGVAGRNGSDGGAPADPTKLLTALDNAPVRPPDDDLVE